MIDMTNKVQKIREEVERLYKEEHSSASTALHKVLDYIDSLPEETVSKAVEEAANIYIKGNYSPWLYKVMFDCFKAGAQWQKEHLRTIGDRTMGKAEKFIQDYTRNCSNVFVNPQLGGTEENHPWLTPDQALRAVEIAREEVMDEVCDYIKNNLYKHLYVYDGQAGFPTHQFIADLKEIWKKNHCIE